MGRNIFDDSDQEDNEDGKAVDIEIDEGYAKRFEHNKKREALHRLDELKKQGLASSDSDEDDDDDDDDDFELEAAAGSSKSELQFYDALIKFKRKDPVLQQKDVRLYSDEDDDDVEKVRRKKEKPLYIKDVVAKQLLEEGADFGEEPVRGRESQSKVYSKEQEENLNAFLEEADGDDDDDDDDELFETKKRAKAEGGDESGEEDGDTEVKKMVDEYWGNDGVLDQKELFLKNFFAKKMWVDKSKAKADGRWGGGDLDVISEDEEALEKQEKYEAEYNFRYEEGTGDRILGHARHIDGSVRKKKNSRQTQRKNKEVRMAQVELERKEELKHLKNLKRKEIEERLQKIRAVAGIGDNNVCKLTEDDLEDEFDPDEYDKKMKETFSMDYYGAEDVDPGFGSGEDDDNGKPDFDKEDELLGLPKDWDVIQPGAGFKTARERTLMRKAEKNGNEENIEDTGEDEKLKEVSEEEEEDQQYESKRKRKRKISLREKVELDKELEDYYKLDYEDTIGELRTRFKYKSVPANRYGLNPAELLTTDDKGLNQYVSLKKLAPYVSEEWKVPSIKRYQMKTKKLQGAEDNNNEAKMDKKHKKHSDHTKSKGKTQLDDAVEEENPSKRKKKRRRQAEIKLSQSRLSAYGL